MATVKAKVLKTKIGEGGAFLALLQFNGKMPEVGDTVSCKWGKARSLNANALYWLFLEFLMEDCGLKDQYLDTEELHEAMKIRFLSKRVTIGNGFETVKVQSTTTLDSTQFTDYMDKIDKAVTEYLGCNTSEFWRTYAENYAKH